MLKSLLYILIKPPYLIAGILEKYLFSAFFYGVSIGGLVACAPSPPVITDKIVSEQVRLPNTSSDIGSVIRVQLPFTYQTHVDGGGGEGEVAITPKLIVTGFSEVGVFGDYITISVEGLPNLSPLESSFYIRDIEKSRNLNVTNLVQYEKSSNNFNFNTLNLLDKIQSTYPGSSNFSFGAELIQERTYLGNNYGFLFSVKNSD